MAFLPCLKLRRHFFEQSLLGKTVAKERRKNHLIWGRKRGQVENLSLNRTKVRLEDSE